MKKLIWNKATKEYLAVDGSWTTDWRRAQVFPTMEMVWRAQPREERDEVELYYQFREEPSEYDFGVSLSRSLANYVPPQATMHVPGPISAH
jgi:hypothetical protein